MATQTRKRTVKPKTTASTPAKRRRTTRSAAVRRTAKGNGNFANFFVPLFFIFCIVFCLGFLGLMGYRTVTASEFFDVKKVDVRGTSRSSKSDIEKIVEGHSERVGVWNTDLTQIKEKVERLAYVKSAAVSRVLPDGVRVNVTERIPKALVRVDGADFWADDEGLLLGLVGEKEERLPFILKGWSKEKNDEAAKENVQRVKTYQKMLEDWREYELANRVETVDLSDPKTPELIVKVEGKTKKVILPKDNFAKKLKSALEHLAGREDSFAGVDVSETSPRLIPN